MNSVADLAKFRESKTPAGRVWRLTPIEPRLRKSILAIDQSLGNAGWAFIESDGFIRACGNVKVTTEETGNAGTLDKGSKQFETFLHLIRDVMPGLVVHEIPPVSRPGAKMARPESSLVSANSLRNAAIVVGLDVRMVSAQTAKKRFTGNHNADKSLVREALHRLDPTLDTRRPMNEHIRDAIALGWVALEEER